MRTAKSGSKRRERIKKEQNEKKVSESNEALEEVIWTILIGF